MMKHAIASEFPLVYGEDDQKQRSNNKRCNNVNVAPGILKRLDISYSVAFDMLHGLTGVL